MDTNSKAIAIAIAPFSSVLTGGVSGLSVIVPLACWLIWKENDSVVDRVGRNVLNSQISWMLWFLATVAFSFVLCLVLIGFLLMFILPPLCIAIWFVFSLIQAVQVSNRNYDYVMPLTIRFLK